MAPADIFFKGFMGMNVFFVGFALKEYVFDISFFFYKF